MLFFFCIIVSKISCCCKNFRLVLRKSKIPTLRLKRLFLVQTELTGVELFLLRMMFFVWIPVIIIVNHLNKKNTVLLWVWWQSRQIFLLDCGRRQHLLSFPFSLGDNVGCFINCRNFLPIWILGKHCQSVLRPWVYLVFNKLYFRNMTFLYCKDKTYKMTVKDPGFWTIDEKRWKCAAA